MSSWSPRSQRRIVSSLNSQGSREVQRQKEIIGESPEKVTILARSPESQIGVRGWEGRQDHDRQWSSGMPLLDVGD